MIYNILIKIKYFIAIVLLTIIFNQIEQPYPPLDLVTIPTSGTLPKGSFTLESLLMNDGGILPKISIGITDNFYIGLSYGIQDFISETKPQLNKGKPEVQLKYRLFEENMSLPALVIGLDTQGKGRYLSRDDFNGNYNYFERYEQKAWGWYLVASKNWSLLGNLGFHIGLNKNTWESDPRDENISSPFKDKDLNFFFGFDKEINRSFSILLEYDAAFNDNDPEIGADLFGRGKGYINGAVRWTVAPNIMIEIDFNDISKNYLSNNLQEEENEYANRELKIVYFEKF